jgi:hypothetical protein
MSKEYFFREYETDKTDETDKINEINARIFLTQNTLKNKIRESDFKNVFIKI